MLNNMTNWLYLLFFIFFITTAITWITFARLTMARIEKQMKMDGLPETFLWDGTGGRVIFYACTLALPEKIAYRVDKRLIDSPLVRSYASRSDRIRAQWFLSSLIIFIVIGFCGFFLGTE